MSLDSDPGLPAAVRTEGLKKSFGGQPALAGVDLLVPEGGVYLLAGVNGAGKSTLLRTLINVETADAGSATVLGRDPRCDGAEVRARTGYVPETGEGLYGWMRTGDFLRHHARFYPGWDQDYADRLAGRLDLRLDNRVGSLSKGQARRVQIVAALAHRPPLLLLDELTDGLDPLAREVVLALLAAHLAETGASVILSTHLVGEVETLVDRIGVLRLGRLVVQDSTDRLLDRLRRYHLDVPDNWRAPPELEAKVLRREAGIGKSTSLVAVGVEAELSAALAASGARLREISRLGLAESVPILLQSEIDHELA